MRLFQSASFLIVIFSFFLFTDCGETQKDPAAPSQATPAFNDYQKIRLKEFEENIMNQGTIEGLEENDVFAVVMDWNLGKGRFATLTVLRDGRTKVFTSTGAKAIDIRHENVFNEVNRFLRSASLLNDQSKKYKNTRLPEEGHFTFYFKTNTGISIGEGHMDDVQGLKSAWAALFNEANSVISEVRRTHQDFYQEE